MNLPRLSLAVTALALALPLPVLADAVVDWNVVSTNAASTAGAPPIQARINAISHLAMHDALNSIDARYRTYAGSHPAAPGASPDAAVATAAYMTLLVTVPGQALSLEETYEDYLGGLSCPQAYATCIADGVAVGIAAANAVLSKRVNDGSATPHGEYSAPEAPGMYQSTAPNFPLAAFSNWGKVKPFALNHGAQFRPEALPLLDMSSATYAQEYAEVMQVGDRTVRMANPDSPESRNARYWASGGADVNAITRSIAANKGLNAWQHARLFALVNLAQVDASISVFNAKYYYRFWRPVTAIHASGNTQWLPYLTTPPYPDYTSGLSALTGSATTVLRKFFGTNTLPYSLQAGGIDRSFTTLSEVESEAAISRVQAGIHFRTACTEGIRHGNRIGQYVYTHFLRPL